MESMDSAGNLLGWEEGAVLPAQMEKKLSEFLVMAEGGESERPMEISPPTC